jgi:hypothetical protein
MSLFRGGYVKNRGGYVKYCGGYVQFRGGYVKFRGGYVQFRGGYVKKKNSLILMATYVSACSPRAAHALRSDQFVYFLEIAQDLS